MNRWSNPAPRGPSENQNTTLGIFFMLLSTLAFAALLAGIRYLSAELHPFEIAFFRYFFGFLVLVPVLVRNGISPFKTHRLGLHALRGGVQAIQGLMSFLAVSLSPLAKIAAVQFTVPLFTAIAAIVILREKMNRGRVTALIVGFFGTWIILRPGADILDIGAVIALIGSIFIAANIIMVKVLARTDSSVTITLYQTIISAPIALIAALFFWETPSMSQLFWLMLIGALGTIAHLALAEACKVADVTALLPYDYMKLIWAVILGYLLFFEFPDLWTFVGGTIIFVCSMYLAFLENKEAK
jgi:drug/metabolite transporter (DMT)-like permease